MMGKRVKQLFYLLMMFLFVGNFSIVSKAEEKYLPKTEKIYSQDGKKLLQKSVYIYNEEGQIIKKETTDYVDGARYYDKKQGKYVFAKTPCKTTEVYTYVSGQLVKQTRYYKKQALSKVTYSYGKGKTTKKYTYNAETKKWIIESKKYESYDSLGRVKKEIYAVKQTGYDEPWFKKTMRFSYDEVGRLIKESYSELGLSYDVSYTYDENGMLIKTEKNFVEEEVSNTYTITDYSYTYKNGVLYKQKAVERIEKNEVFDPELDSTVGKSSAVTIYYNSRGDITKKITQNRYDGKWKTVNCKRLKYKYVNNPTGSYFIKKISVVYEDGPLASKWYEYSGFKQYDTDTEDNVVNKRVEEFLIY